MISPAIATRFPIRLLSFGLRAVRRTLIFALTVLWLLFFVLVLVPMARLVFTIVAAQ